MHPAPSVVIFTTFSGLGFGLLFFLGLGMPAPSGRVAFVFFAIAYARGRVYCAPTFFKGLVTGDPIGNLDNAQAY